MKYELPEGHGLGNSVLSNPLLFPSENGQPSITDAQYDALAAGVARGKDILVSAPTSTGKTLIGWWGVNSALSNGGRIVYLVSYRALAHQKFEEAQRLFLQEHLQGDRSAIVCATGDSIEDASGRKTSAPLSSCILVATYEKFLGCLSTGGPPRDLTDTTFICDEIQLIGEKSRGQNVELLLTLLKRSGWRQFIGLSAVLSQNDSQALADWLNIKLVRNPNREKKLTIECRSSEKCITLISAPGHEPVWKEQSHGQRSQLTSSIVAEMSVSPTYRPVIVFCMKVDDTFALAKQMASTLLPSRQIEVPPGLDIDASLLELLKKGVAFHNAELSEEERLFVETRLEKGEVDIVFSTSTLAAGVNFPLGSAVFAGWKRWNFERGRHEPISRSEFQNMAGRVGRMGQAGDCGRVILSSTGYADAQFAAHLMNMVDHDDLGCGIKPDDFGPLVLQILAGGLCSSREQAFELLTSTLSAARESARNISGVVHWRHTLDQHVDRLIQLGCVIETGCWLTMTALGKAVARSGLKPETAMYFIEGLVRFGEQLVELLPSKEGEHQEDDLAFVLAHAALASPEFSDEGGRPSRNISWRVSNNNLVNNPCARRLEGLLFSQPWVGNVAAANGALLLTAWASGQPRRAIEASVGTVRLGTVQAMARDVAWILTGVSEIIGIVAAPTLADESKPTSLRVPDTVRIVRWLVRAIRRQASRINVGLPGDALWLKSLDLQDQPRRLSRPQILALHSKGLVRSIDLMNGAPEADVARREALEGVINPRLANLVRDAARRWKMDEREYCKKYHLNRAMQVGLADIVEVLYASRGAAFEKAFATALDYLGISCKRLDKAGRVGYPDFLVEIEGHLGIVAELKTKASDTDLVNFNSVTEVLGASELIGMREHPCLTICNPGVEPSVPGLIESCGRLCVAEICDFIEAILRLREESISIDEFYNWLITPGIALREDLPHSR